MRKNKNRTEDDISGQISTSSTTWAEPELERGRFGPTWLDYLVSLLAAVLAAVWAFRYVGTSVNWDDLFYMNLSQYTTPQAWVLNRYGHIYLQKFFFWLANDALTGTRLYWCFLFFSSSALVYLSAKMLAGKRGWLTGLIAVLFFCIQPIFARSVGCTFADFTVMFLMAMGTFVYLAFPIGRQKYRHLVVAILGLIFFWAVKSKETGICLAVLFWGLGEDRAGVRNVRMFVRDVGWVCVGMLIGFVLLMILDFGFMGDALFSVRPSNIKALFAWNTGEWVHDEKGSSLYALLSGEPILPAFLLYLFIGWKGIGKDLSRYEKAAWLIPLAVMFFLIAITVQIRTVSPFHYFAPAIPGLCVWAAQFFRFWPIESGKPISPFRILVGSVIVLLAFIIVSLLMHEAPESIKDAGWKSLDLFYSYAILPLATTGLLICASLLRMRRFTTLFLLSFCLFCIVYIPFRNNLVLLEGRAIAKRSEWRYEPYRVFAKELRFDGNPKILVSKDIHRRSWMLGRNVESHCWMFNVFFNQKFDYDNFIDGDWEDVLKGNYTYAFLTYRDWKGITEKYDVKRLLSNYDVKLDNTLQLVLLKKR